MNRRDDYRKIDVVRDVTCELSALIQRAPGSGGSQGKDRISEIEWAWYEGFHEEVIDGISLVCREICCRLREVIGEGVELYSTKSGILLRFDDGLISIEHRIESRILDLLLSSDCPRRPLESVVVEVAMRFISAELHSQVVDDAIVEKCRALIRASDHRGLVRDILLRADAVDGA